MKYSVVIPTYKHLDDCLKPCLESIVKYTDLYNDIEIIIVANGCGDDGTREFVESLGEPFKLIWLDSPSGYTKSTNIGIKASTGDYVVLLNNDTILLDQIKNTWIKMLVTPFLEDPKMGITGPMKSTSEYSNRPFIIFFCAMVSKEMFDKFGLLDEIFSPGFGEDIDFCHRVEDNGGYKIAQVPGIHSKMIENNKIMCGSFPIFHAGEKTFAPLPTTTSVFARNGKLITERYRPKTIKLNLGCGNQPVAGYINIDLNDPNADINADVRSLTYEDNSVDEILAIHLFEHFSPYEAYKILAEWHRVLKTGGKLVLELPDIEELCKQFVTADKSKRYVLINCIYGTMPTTPHLFGWYEEILMDHLRTIGFRVMKRAPVQFTYHMGYNMRIEAIKINADSLPDGFFGEDDILVYRDLLSRLENDSKIVEVGCFKGKSICSVADVILNKNITGFVIDNYAFDYYDVSLLERVESDMPTILNNNLIKY